MQIFRIYPTPKSEERHAPQSIPPRNGVSFGGHYGFQCLVKGGEDLFLRHQTGLFRDIGTKNAVKKYITDFWENKPKIKIVVGACSTGEEAYTYSMLLKSVKPKVSILGFDLSPNAVKLAKTKKLVMERAGRYIEMDELRDTSYYDTFLCFDAHYRLTPEDMEYKKLFDEFFEVSQEAPDAKLWDGIVNLKKTFWDKLFNRERSSKDIKVVKLNKGKAENCKFVEGDIRELGRITKGEKAEIITFSNALYHLTTEESSAGRVQRKNSEQIIRQIVNSVKQNLKESGLFVIGEEELDQMLDDKLLPKVLKEHGFTPIYGKFDEIPSVWCLSTSPYLTRENTSALTSSKVLELK